MAKFAIGMTINGNEVRAAFLTLVRGKARIRALESTKLVMPLEEEEGEAKGAVAAISDLENAFDINEPKMQAEDDGDEVLEDSEKNQNVSVVYALLDKFQNIRANLAINSPILTVRYDFLDKEAVPKEKKFKMNLKQGMDILGGGEQPEVDGLRRSKYIDISDGKVLQIDYEYHPAVIDLMEEVNQFRSGNLNMVLMDTNELALVDLVNEIYKFDKDEITAIIYVEQDFSRVIFLKGRQIYHITPIVHKGSDSKDVLEVIYSRMLFAQDHYFIPEINKILVAGHSSRLKAKYFFRQKFPSAVTGYLNSKKIQSDLRFKDRGLLFSRYAVPIALAWKGLQKNVYKTKQRNLLPEYIQERQTLPSLSLNGFALLALLTVTAFGFSWFLVNKNLQIREVSKRVQNMKQQIENNEALTDRVQAFDGQIIDIEKKIKLVNEHSEGYTRIQEFLSLLNEKVTQTGDIWINSIDIKGNNVNISGIAKRRTRIPQLANALGGANLKKVTRSNYLGNDVFNFNLEHKLDQEASDRNLTIFSKLERQLTQMGSRRFDKPSSGSRGTVPRADQNVSGVGVQGKEETAANGHGNGVAGSDRTESEDREPSEQTVVDQVTYALQLGPFGSREQARKQAEQFSSKGYRVTVQPRGDNFNVIVGEYRSHEAAQQLSNYLALRSGIQNKVIKMSQSEFR